MMFNIQLQCAKKQYPERKCLHRELLSAKRNQERNIGVLSAVKSPCRGPWISTEGRHPFTNDAHSSKCGSSPEPATSRRMLLAAVKVSGVEGSEMVRRCALLYHSTSLD